MEYKQQLADSRWLKKKNEILERDNYTCQHCGRTSNLNVHHLSYEKGKLAWDYPNEKLITLWVDCHENEHNIVTYPKIGKFYTYHHSDYWNDMICFYIDRKRNQIGLFGVDCGGYGTAYVDFLLLTFSIQGVETQTFISTLKMKNAIPIQQVVFTKHITT